MANKKRSHKTKQVSRKSAKEPDKKRVSASASGAAKNAAGSDPNFARDGYFPIVCIGASSFFRDAEAFDALQGKISHFVGIQTRMPTVDGTS